MKKLACLLLGFFLLSSCLNNELPDYKYEFVAINEATTPANFTFGEKDTIYLKYSFPNGCYQFNEVYYEYQDTTRVVAITAFINLEDNCTQAIIEKSYELVVDITQEQDYLFKFYKGKDSIGKNIFEEVIIPVN